MLFVGIALRRGAGLGVSLALHARLILKSLLRLLLRTVVRYLSGGSDGRARFASRLPRDAGLRLSAGPGPALVRSLF